VSFTLDQFGDVLKVRDAAGRPYVVIGGQAVNYWATRYLKDEPALLAWQPFTSNDLDFRGNRDDVMRIAAHLKRSARFPHKKLMTAFAGAILWNIGEGMSAIDLVRHVPGVTTAEVEKLAIAHEFSGQPIRVIDPVSLLKCKLDLAFTVDQSGRRDAEHVRILVICVRAFVRETLRGVEAGELPARGWLGAVERVLKLAESTLGRKATQRLNVDWLQVLPEAEIAASQSRLVVPFREKRLPQWLAKILSPNLS
jgi:hypothetical protein